MSATADFYQHFAERGLVPLVHEGAPWPPSSTEPYQCRDGSTMAVPCMTITEARRDHSHDEHIAAFLDCFASTAFVVFVFKAGGYVSSVRPLDYSPSFSEAFRFRSQTAAAACAADVEGIISAVLD